jgi:hypothetical protein
LNRLVCQQNTELTNVPIRRDFGPYRRAAVKQSNTNMGFKYLKDDGEVVISVVISPDDRLRREVQ